MLIHNHMKHFDSLNDIKNCLFAIVLPHFILLNPRNIHSQIDLFMDTVYMTITSKEMNCKENAQFMTAGIFLN